MADFNLASIGLDVLFKGKNMARLIGGLGVALKISLLAVAISIPSGILLGVLMTWENKIVRFFLRVYLEFIRIMPQLVLLFIVFFGSTKIMKLHVSGEMASIIVFSLWGTAEMADLVRGALSSIPKHQYESAAALGLTKTQTFFHVILPQTIRRLLPISINLITRKWMTQT